MSEEKIYIFDTTLRDGAQTQGVDFSIDEKNRIATALSKFCLLYTSPSPRDRQKSRMPSSA